VIGDPTQACDDRRAVLARTHALIRSARDGCIREVLSLLEGQFGPAELHVATPEGYAATLSSGTTGAEPRLVRRAAARRRATVGDSTSGSGTALACPVLSGGRVVAVVTVVVPDGWTPSAASLAEGVIAVGTPCFVAEQRRVVDALATNESVRNERRERLVHDDAAQILVAVAERLDLVRTGVVPTSELVVMRAELLRAAERLVASVSTESGAGW
jgi:hypothetical protein